MNRAAVETWVRSYVEVVAPLADVRERPWSTVARVPVVSGNAWFKACVEVQAFEPWLTAGLRVRWPDRVPEVLAHDEERAWLLLADAGTPLRELGNPPEAWLRILPLYAELQRGEAGRVEDDLAHGVPDLRVAAWPERYEELLRHELPLAPGEIDRLREHAPRFVELSAELAARAIPQTVQHDDLHMGNVYARGDGLRILDWGDSSISHPFASLVVTFRFLEELNGMPPDDPWLARLRDAYLEPWGADLRDTFALALRAGAFAHAFAWLRHRERLTGDDRRGFDKGFAIVLRRALALAGDEFPPPQRS